MNDFKNSLHGYFNKPENLFIIIASLFGFLFLIANPPFEGPDEPDHFYRMYNYSSSKYKLFNKDGVYAQSLPKSVVKVTEYYYSKILSRQYLNLPVKSNFQENFRILKYQKLNKSKSEVTKNLVTNYNKIAYFPHWCLIWLMELLNFTPLLMVYVLRACSLILYTFLIHYAIKITPVKKWLFFVVATLPMSLYIAATISPDPLTIGLSFLFTAYLLNLAFNPDITKLSSSDYAKIAILLFLISMCKFPYLLLSFLFFLIPKEKFEAPKKSYIFFIGILVLCSLAILIHIVNSSKVISLLKFHETKTYSELTMYIIHHPVLHLKAVLYTIYKQFFYYIESYIGILGWLYVRLPLTVILMYMLLLLYVSLYDFTQGITISLKNKIILFLLPVSVYFPLLTMIYFAYQHFPLISGVQGRYLIPTSVCFFLVFYNQKFHSKYLKLITITATVCGLLSGLCVLISFYY